MLRCFSPENTLPDDVYMGKKKESEEADESEYVEKHGLLDNLKQMVGL